MDEPINPLKGHSGQENKSYVFNGLRIEVLPYFLYEVSLHKYWKNGYCLLGTRYFRSDSLLAIKKDRKYKKCKDYIVEKEICLLGAPYGFIRENNLPVYEPIIKQKKSRKK